jgi:phytoene synthase
VLSATPSLSRTRKLWLLAKTRAYWALTKDPERVFYRVTGLASTPEQPHPHADPQPAP